MTQSTSTPFRADIEGLRGIAVLMVVAFHCGLPGVSGGFIGVDVFFVLSGYLITGLLVAEVHKTGRLDLLQFYARRVRRLLPASALMLLVTLLGGALILAPHELTFTAGAARASAVYISNLYFARNAADYFAPGVEGNPMLHTWSLAVEEQFYVFWPLLIILCLRFLHSRMLLLVLSALSILSLGISLFFTATNTTFAFYQLPARAWEFGIGGLATLLPRGALRLSSRHWAAWQWAGVLVILGSGCLIRGNTHFPGWIALIPVVGTVVALVAGAESGHSGALLGSMPLQFLGKLSYSWYLWHWPFLVFSIALFRDISIGGKVTAAILSLAVAGITHHFVENPIRFRPYLMKRPAVSLGLAGALTLCSLGTAVVSMRFAQRLANMPEMKKISAAVEDLGGLSQPCISLRREGATVKTCAFGDAAAPVSIVLFGDSHAIQWFNPLRRMTDLYGWKVVTMVKSGCPAADIRLPDLSAGFITDCAAWRANAIQQIVDLRPSLVLIGNAANVYLGRKDLRTTPVSTEEWRSGSRRTLEALSAAGIPVAAMRDSPLFPFDIPTCLARSVLHSWYSGGSCDVDRTVALKPAFFEAEEASARDLPNVHFIDLTDQLCRQDVCRTIQEGEVMYRDDNHLTGRFASDLTHILEARLRPVLNQGL